MKSAAVTGLGAWVVLVLAALFLLTTGGTYPGIASVQAHAIGQIVAIAVLGGWLAIALVRPAWRPRTPLLLPVALASAAYLASAVVSQRPRLSFEPTIAGLGWALAFLFLSRLLTSEWFRARVAVLMTAFVAVVAFGYIGQVIVEWVNWWGLIGRLAVPPLRPSFAGLFLGSPNLIGTALVLLAPLVVAIAWSRYRRRSVAIALALASAVAILLCGSRGAWLGVGVGVILAFVLVATRPGARLSPAALVARLRSRPILLLPVALLGAAGLVLAPSLLQRFEQGGATLRLDLWRSALSIFADHPILGAGPGTWVQLKVAANPEGVPNLILPQAHDMYVQAAAELGVVGLVALAILSVAVLRRLWTAWRPSDRPTTGPTGPTGRIGPTGPTPSLSLEAGAVMVGLAAFAAQSIVDNFTNLPFVCLILVAMVAWVDGGLAQSGDVRPERGPSVVSRSLAIFERGPLLPVLGLVAFAAVVPTLLRIDRAAALALDGNDAALRGHWQLALDAYDAARVMDPGFTLYEIQTASALARVGRTAEARDLLAHAVESDPTAVNVIGLAALEAELGDREAALAHLRTVPRLGFREPMVALNAGLIAERYGERELALDQFANAIAWDPPLAGSGLWVSPPRLVTKEEIVAAARARVDPLEAALILAYAGQPLEARAELDALPASSKRAAYIAATEWRAHDAPRALARLTAILQEDPLDWLAAGWAARIANASIDRATSDHYAAWAIAVQGDTAPGVIHEASAVPASPSAPTASLPGNYPWGVYLRPITPWVLMPQLTLIGLR